VLVEQRWRVVVAGALQNAIVHLAQVGIEDNLVAASNDDLSRSGSALEIAGIDRVELHIRQPRSNSGGLFFAPLVQDDIEMALKDPFGVRACLTVPDKPECGCHECLPVSCGRAAGRRPSHSL